LLSYALEHPSRPQSTSGLARSKTWRPRLAYFGFRLSAFCLRAWRQYSIDWSRIDDGGGTGTGGVYSVTGTISVTFTNNPANGNQFFRLHKPT
jgi:hypothetical protein